MQAIIKKESTSLVLLFLLMLLVAGVCLMIGPIATRNPTIIFEIRFPRILLALLVGAGLSGAGAVLQGVLRNPLADPFILGTSGAATMGVMLAGILGLSHYSFLYFLALGFALFSIFLVYRIAKQNGKTPIQTLILAGVIVSLFFNALVFVFFSIFYRDSYTVLFYLLGSLTEGDSLRMSISAVLILFGFMISWFYSRELNLLTQGEETAEHLGVQVERAKKILFVSASAMVAASVAIAGMIGFVGLIIPHMMRMLVGPDHRILIPASAIGGAIILVLTDAIARSAIPPLEIPVGALTALLGAPYFIYLLRKKQHAGEF